MPPCACPGAKVLCGGKRHGAIYEATLLKNVPWNCNVVQYEAFGPVACLVPYDGYEKAVDMCSPLGSLDCAGQVLGLPTSYFPKHVWAMPFGSPICMG